MIMKKIDLLLIVTLLILIKTIDISFISGTSMMPTLKSNNIAITVKPKEITRGDIVGIKVLNENLCKRVVAIPYDTILFDVENSIIYVNGEKESYSDYAEPMQTKIDYLTNYFLTNSYEYKQYKLKDNQYLVLGDNRGASTDSRNFGYISKEKIICEFIFILPLGFE